MIIALHLQRIAYTMGMIKGIVLTFGLVIVSLHVSGQNGSVTIVKDPRIDGLVKKQSEVIPPATAPQITGYRIQLFFDSEKSKVDQARIRFVTQFPKVETYITYNAPNYFLRVGDFRTQLEADKVKAELGQEFPTSFVVKEKINLPRID